MDEEGFLYPAIDEDLCSRCLLCKDVCSFQREFARLSPNENQIFYAVKNKDERIRENSTSGGAFSALADRTLELGGVVYGAAFDTEFRLHHVRIGHREELDSLRGSKYIQSDMQGIFENVRGDLGNGLPVLFTGTPCQVGGLKGYLGQDYPRLLLVDLICHGTPSPLVWHNHIVGLQKSKGRNIARYEFRSKIFGWHRHTEMATFSDGRTDYASAQLTSFRNLFYSGFVLRPACYSCIYTCPNRTGDLTLGDFWGIERAMPPFDDDKGVSLVMVNTAKGRDVFAEMHGRFFAAESCLEACEQPQLKNPTAKPTGREMFWVEYRSSGHLYCIRKYAGYDLRGRVKGFVKSTAIFRWHHSRRRLV